ncbi:MAG TPA: hypothetical protein VIK93_03480 [Limnochordales bacterium]
MRRGGPVPAAAMLVVLAACLAMGMLPGAVALAQEAGAPAAPAVEHGSPAALGTVEAPVAGEAPPAEGSTDEAAADNIPWSEASLNEAPPAGGASAGASASEAVPGEVVSGDASGEAPSPRTLGQAAPVGVVGSALGLPVDPLPLTLGLHLGPDPWRASANMALAAVLGAAVVPIEFAWERVQPAPGTFAWNDFDLAVRRARDLGLQPVGVFVYPPGLPWPTAEVRWLGWPTANKADWLFFVQQVAARFAGAIAEWIVVRDEPPDADPLLWAREAVPYARFVQDTAAAIRAVQADARVRAAANAGDLLWLEVLVREGGLAGLDGLVLEANRWPAPPEGLAVTIGEVRGLLRSLGYDLELWVWRFGYPTHIGVSRSLPHRTGVSEEQQAEYLARSHVAFAQAGVGVVFYQELVDAGWERDVADANFGLVRRDGEAKPAAAAYRTLAQQLGGRTYGLPQPVSPDDGDDAAVQAMGVVLAALRGQMGTGAVLSQVAVHPFAGRPGDSLVVVLWSAAHPVDAPMAVVPLAELALPAWVQVRVLDAQGRPLDRVPIAAAPVYLSIAAVDLPGTLPDDGSAEGRGE